MTTEAPLSGNHADMSIYNEYNLTNHIEQSNPFCDKDEHLLYHDNNRSGYFTLLWVDPILGKKSSGHLLSQISTVIEQLPKNRDTWISQCEFYAPRRLKIFLSRIPLLFIDVDCYKLNLSPEQALFGILNACDDFLPCPFPHPTVANFSGRGIQLKWVLNNSLPRHALPRWKAFQEQLCLAFKKFGADSAALDACRVLRLNHTTNSRSGERVRILHITEDNVGNPMTYDFEYLAEIMLPNGREKYDKKLQNHPFSQQEKDSMVANRLLREANPEHELNKGGRLTVGLSGFSSETLAWDRLEDIRTLQKMRGGVPEGQGMNTLFYCLNFLQQSGTTDISTFFNEATELCKEFNFVGDFNRADELSTLYAKAKDHEAGKTVKNPFNGKDMPPLYTPRNETLINLFEITTEEQKHLRTIISPEIAKARDAERKRIGRKATGAISRNDYLMDALNKRSIEHLLRATGDLDRLK